MIARGLYIVYDNRLLTLSSSSLYVGTLYVSGNLNYKREVLFNQWKSSGFKTNISLLDKVIITNLLDCYYTHYTIDYINEIYKSLLEDFYFIDELTMNNIITRIESLNCVSMFEKFIKNALEKSIQMYGSLYQTPEYQSLGIKIKKSIELFLNKLSIYKQPNVQTQREVYNIDEFARYVNAANLVLKRNG